VTQDVPVTAAASDLDGFVTKVEFYEILNGNTNFIDQAVS
jgi:hypothetical protein